MENLSQEDLEKRIEERDVIIGLQSRKIAALEEQVGTLTEQRNKLLEKLKKLTTQTNSSNAGSSCMTQEIKDRSVSEDEKKAEEIFEADSIWSITSTRSSDELLRRRAPQPVAPTRESISTSKLIIGNKGRSSSLQRQRSLKRDDDDIIKRSRVQSSSYELSQDLQDKQVEMLERKYGGSIRARRAARTIQRAFRQYCMSRNFLKLRNSVADKRLSKRLSELGRSNTIWTDRIYRSNGIDNMGASYLQNPDLHRQTSYPEPKQRLSEHEFNHRSGESKLYHQMSLDPSVKMDAHRVHLSRKERRKLERTAGMDVDFHDIPVNQVMKGKYSEETNNNRNSYPELNNSATGSSQPAIPENPVDVHSLDFETLLESKETDILTDSFHSDGIHSDTGHDFLHLTHRPSGSSLASDISAEYSIDSAKGSSLSSDIARTPGSLSSDSTSTSSDMLIKSDGAKDSRTFSHRSRSQPQLQNDAQILKDQSVKYFMNTAVKLRNRPEENKKSKGPEASPIWKRKSSTGANGSTTVLVEDPNRMSNISETSEAESFDGHCSSSPSSDNISSENISIGSSENSISYQRRLRLSVTPDHPMAPRVSDKQRKRLYRVGLNLFNKKPEKGLHFLLDNSFIDEYPRTVARFLITRKGLSKYMIGEYLGNLQNQFNMDVLHCFTDEIDLSGLQVDVALRKFQCYFRMPGEAQKIERLMEAFAQRYCLCNPDQIKNFKNPETIFLLAFAIIMLNTDLHNSNIKPERKMKLEDFIKNLRGIDAGADVDRDTLVGIYERVKAQEFKSGVDHVTQVAKVEQTIVGKKPKLALPHRRLVCYCRLYEVHDPNKKEKIGLHQREVFLFNDLILVSKIFSKKKTGITYAFKQSFSLYGMHVFLFETQHYQFGVKLTNNIDGKVLVMFNARNDHDRQKFVEDLKEAILETNGMEQLRIEDEINKHCNKHNTIDKHYSNDDSRVLMYDLLAPNDPAVNRLSAPECAGMKKNFSTSFTDLCAEKGMRRGSSGGSLDSGMVSGSVGSGNSKDDPFGHATFQIGQLGPANSTGRLINPSPRNSPVLINKKVPEGTEV